MRDIKTVSNEYIKETADVKSFCDEIYRTMVGTNFEEVQNLYRRLKSNIRPISDEELEYVITIFPMELITVAENLNKLRLEREVMKLKNKEIIEELRAKLKSDSRELDDFTKAEKQAWIQQQISAKMVEYDVLLAAYDSVITRIENEQSFSRELIMGAKKVWDSRRSTENVIPIEPPTSQLPEYERKSYIK